MANTVLVPKLGNLPLLKASDVGQAWGLNMLIYGVSGAGKTTLAATAQDSEYGRDVLFVDLEGGTLSIADRPDIAVFRPAAWDDLQKVFQALQAGGHGFKTVIVDSLTEAQTLALKSVTGNREQLTQQDWGKTNDRVLGMVRAFRGLSHSREQPVNTIFVALERETRDEQTGRVRVGPALTPGSTVNVAAAVDSVAYLTWEPKTGKRVLHLDGNGQFLAKVRQPRGGRLPARLDDPSLVPILAALRGKSDGG